MYNLLEFNQFQFYAGPLRLAGPLTREVSV